MKTLFLLGHMRSYSSVLSHILGSHPQISGYCETHTKYRTWFDLWKLRWRVRKLTGEALRGDYVLDKVLHDYPMARSILDSSSTRAIVLIRRPRETVRSIIEMGLTLKHGSRVSCGSPRRCVVVSCSSKRRRFSRTPAQRSSSWGYFSSCTRRYRRSTAASPIPVSWDSEILPRPSGPVGSRPGRGKIAPRCRYRGT